METPLRFDFVNLARAQSLETLARDKARALERFCDRIISCHVTLEAQHGNHQQGRPYHAHIRLTVPGAELISSRNPQDKCHADATVAVRDAFHTIRRQLLEHMSLQRGDVKAHSLAG